MQQDRQEETKSTNRRNEILEAAKKLLYTKGYDQMTIQDLLDELNISKGAFYHYFSSKQNLLDAIIEQSVEEMEKILLPIANDSAMRTLEKFTLFFDTASSWKTARKPLMLALMRAWQLDENALFRQKSEARALERIIPLLDPIIQQGLQEGVFSSPYPAQLSELAMMVMRGLSNSLTRQFMAQPFSSQLAENIVQILAAYTHTLEQVLGAVPGSLQMIDPHQLKEWANQPENP